MTCVTPVPEEFPIGVIIVIVLIVLAIVIVITLVLFLVWLWKYRNDAFYRYVCCCLQGKSAKSQMYSLQQENYQRLHHEQSQQQLEFSRQFTQGGLGECTTHVQ